MKLIFKFRICKKQKSYCLEENSRTMKKAHVLFVLHFCFVLTAQQRSLTTSQLEMCVRPKEEILIDALRIHCVNTVKQTLSSFT